MAEKRVNVRLAAVGGRQTRQQLEAVGQAGAKGMARFRSEVDRANKRLARFARRARRFARIAAAAIAGAVAAMVRSGLQVIDSQAKLAQALNTTTESVQVLARAADLTGTQWGELEGGAQRLTRRLSLFATDGSGPAANAIERLGLNAERLLRLPLDQRIREVSEAIRENASAAEQAALFSQLFGDRAFAAFQRLDTAALAQARTELERFGALVSEEDAAQIERTNDALSSLGLIWRGLSNQLAVAVAPALERVANRLADLASQSGPLGRALRFLGENLERVVAVLGTFAALIAGRLIARVAAFALGIRGAATAFVVLRAAMIRVPFVAIIALGTELIVKFVDLVRGTGDFGQALRLLGDVAMGVFEGIIASGRAVGPALEAVWQRVKAGFLNAVADMTESWQGFLQSVAAVGQAGGAVIPGLAGLGVAAEAALGKIGEVRASAEDANASSRELGRIARVELSAGFEEARAAFARVNDTIERGRAGAQDFPLDPGFVNALRDAQRAANDLDEDLGDIGGEGGSGGGGGGGSAARAGAALKNAGETAADAWRKTAERMKAAQERAKETARELAQDITGPIKSALKEGELSWRGFADAIAGIAQNLASRLIDVAFKPIEDALVRAFTGGGAGGGMLGGLFGIGGGGGGAAGGGGGLLPSLLPFARGGAFTRAGEVRAFARGGVVNRPAVFPFANGTGLMGEAGPEAIMPLKRGRGGRLGVEASGGGQERGTRIVNVLDPSIVGDYLATPDGERVIVNTIRRNREAINA